MAATWIAWIAAVALGQVVDVPVFEGLYADSFNEPTEPHPVCRDFDEVGQLCSEFVLSDAGAWSGDCRLSPVEGALLVQGTSTMELELDVGVRRFGGWFAQMPITHGHRATFRFYDVEDRLIGARSLSTVECDWVWGGWAFERPVHRVQIQSAFWSGGYLPMDDFQADPSPRHDLAGRCVELTPELFADAQEWCDGLDNDCNGVIDDVDCAELVEREGRQRRRDKEVEEIGPFWFLGCGCTATGSGGGSWVWLGPLALAWIRSERRTVRRF